MTPGAIAGLILAAGESRRMGQDKALLEYHGRPFLQVILENLLQAGIDRRVAVLGHHAAEIQRVIHPDGVEVVINADYRLGQTSSLQAGLRALDSEKVAGVLLCLVDHPAASAEVMQRLARTFRESGAPVIIPLCNNRRGHPVFFSRAMFAELLALDAQQGANVVVRKYHNVTCYLEVKDPGVLLDVDRPQDYQTLCGSVKPKAEVGGSDHHPEPAEPAKLD